MRAISWALHRISLPHRRLSVEVNRMGYFSELVRARELELTQIARYRLLEKKKTRE